MDGHPLSLRLLGGAFDGMGIPLEEFLAGLQDQLDRAEDQYQQEAHRHRSLYACIGTSVLSLSGDLRDLLSGLWVFHAPFQAEEAVAVFDPAAYPEGERSPVYGQLHRLWQRGLLSRDRRTLRDGEVMLYRLVPAVRPYVDRYMDPAHDRDDLLARFGEVYAGLARAAYRELDRSAVMVYLARQARPDLERGWEHTGGEERGYYLTRVAWIEGRLGYSGRALELAQQAVELARKMNLPDLENAALHIQAVIYGDTGQPLLALGIYKRTLELVRATGDRTDEAVTLNNMAAVYDATGRPGRALELYEQALPITREVGDRAGEAVTLNNMASVYDATGRPGRALELYEQALPITREVGDRAGEAGTLNNMALVYGATGRPGRALELYEQALPLSREVGDRAGEAVKLNNMAGVYYATGRPGRALELYEQALPLRREVGDRAGEAMTLNNMALTYYQEGEIERAIAVQRSTLDIFHEIGAIAEEVWTLGNLSIALHRVGQTGEAIELLERAIALLTQYNLPQDAGGTTLAEYETLLAQLRSGEPLGRRSSGPSTMPADQIETVVANTIAVLTVAEEKRDEWREAVAGALLQARERERLQDAEFFEVVLALQDGEEPSLPPDHPYATALAAIRSGAA